MAMAQDIFFHLARNGKHDSSRNSNVEQKFHIFDNFFILGYILRGIFWK